MSLAPRYHLVDDFAAHRPTSGAERAGVEYAAYSPYCVVCVLPLNLPASADRTRMGVDDGGASKSFSSDPSDGVRLRYPPLVVTGDIQSCRVAASKGSPTSRMQLQLSASTVDYFAAVLPGDWVCCWIVGSEERGRSIVDRIGRLEPCNGFYDGLRFVGQVASTGADEVSTPTGLVAESYTVSCAGFQQLESQIFYDPYLAEQVQLMGSWLARLNQAVSELLGTPSDDAASSAAIDINRAIPFLFNMLVGEGVPRRFTNPGGDPELEGRVFGLKQGSGEAPFALTVPGELGLLLGKRSRSRGTIPAYADVCELLTGVQRFTGAAGQDASPSAPWAIFTPDGVEPPPAGETEVASRKATATRLLGQFIPTIPDFTNKPVWSILRQFLNPAINEMYSVLRANEAGQVVPTVVVRQIPLSSEVVAEKVRSTRNLTLTPMLEVPRWVGHPLIVRRLQRQRDDGLRFNFVHVYGQAPDMQAAAKYTYQIVRSPPARNDLDAQRSGMRGYMSTVSCSIDEEKLAAQTWIGICSDWLMDQQLTVAGTCEMELVPAPICHGDNFELHRTVYQIEGTEHHFAVSMGKRMAGTTLQLTHGVRSDDDPGYKDRTQGDGYIFAGTLARDRPHSAPSVWASEERQKPKYGNLAADAEPPGGFTPDPGAEVDALLRSLK